MAYRTVNLKPETHRRLAAYRAFGETFDDVIAHLMDRVPAKALHAELVRKAARELAIPNGLDDAVLEFRDESRPARAPPKPGPDGARGVARQPTRAAVGKPR